MATPNSLAFMIQAGVSLTEVWFIGRLGGASLASIALVFPLLMLMQMLSGGALGGAITSSIARAIGAGNRDRAQSLIWHALALTAMGAVILLCVYLFAGESFLRLLGGEGEILSQAHTYCLILFPGGIFIWLMGSVGAVYRGMGNMKFPAAMMIISAVIQVPLSAVLILGLFGLPQLGMPGAAVSAILSAVIINTIMLVRLAQGHERLKLDWHYCHFVRPDFQDILKVAMPASLSPVTTVATILSLTAIVGSFGADALAGYGIGSRVEFLMVPLVFGLGAAMTSLVGMSIGAGDIDRAEKVGFIGGAASAVIAGSIGLTLALLSDWWIPVFTSESGIHQSAARYIHLVGPCYIFYGLGLSLYFASQGASAMLWPVSATVIRLFIAAGGAIVLSQFLDFGLDGVYIAAAMGMVIYGSMIGLSVKLGAWRGT
jgi:putative MATE family efflux protein